MGTKKVMGVSVLSSLLTTLVIFAVLAGANITLAQAPEPQLQDADVGILSNQVAELEEAAPDVTTNYHHVAGSTFIPLYGSTDYQYVPGGCIYVTSGSTYLNAPLILPSGAKVTTLRLYFKDSNESINGTLRLREMDDGLGFKEIAMVSSSGSAGTGNSTVTLDTPLAVDYLNFSYVLQWYQGTQLDSSVTFCGYRVTYTLPSVFGIALPLMQR